MADEVTCIVDTAATAWVASTEYDTVGTVVTNDSAKRYKLVTAGTSAGSGGPTGTGTGISDGTCTWDYYLVHYTGLNAAIVGETGASPLVVTGTNLVTNDEQLTISCCASRVPAGTYTADTTAASLEGFTTDATSYIKVHSIGAHRHAGVWDDSKYRLDVVGNPLSLDGNRQDYIIEGLQIGRNSSSGNYSTTIVHSQQRDGLTILDSCILRGSGNAYRPRLILLGVDSRYSPHVTYRNNIIYRLDTTSHAAGSVFYRNYAGDEPTDDIRIENNTIIGGVAHLVYFVSLPVAVPVVNYNNNIFTSSGTIGTGTTVLTGNNNMFSQDDDIGGANDIRNVVTKYSTDTLTAAAKSTDNWVIFESSTDFDLVSENDGGELNDAIGAGGDLSARFAYDIIGTARPQGTYWDIGAFEYVAAVGGTKGGIMLMMDHFNGGTFH